MSGLTRMGYEKQIFCGTAGSTATTKLTNTVDIDYNIDPERGATTTRGEGTSVPIATSQVTELKPSISWKMLNKPADTMLAAIIVAAKTGAAIAIRTRNYASGLGYDGDVTVGMKNAAPIKGEQAFEFTAEATDDEGRAPQLWV